MRAPVLGHAVDNAGVQGGLRVGRVAREQDQVVRLLHHDRKVVLRVPGGWGPGELPRPA